MCLFRGFVLFPRRSVNIHSTQCQKNILIAHQCVTHLMHTLTRAHTYITIRTVIYKFKKSF